MPIKKVLTEVKLKMTHAVDYFHEEMQGIRTGRASAGLVDHIKIDYYGSPTDLRQLAAISTPEPSLIVVKPFDPGTLKTIEKTIQSSDLGITPMADGKVIRLKVPALSGERRTKLIAQVKKMSEASKISVRNARRDGNKAVDKIEKSHDISEDNRDDAKDDIQSMTKSHEKQIDEAMAKKVAEIEEI